MKACEESKFGNSVQKSLCCHMKNEGELDLG